MRTPRQDPQPRAPAGQARALERAVSWGRKNVLAVAITALVYFVAGKLGLTLAFLHASATPVWPPAGIALAAFLLIGNRLWPGIFLGAFLVNITTAGSPWTAIGIATGNTLEGLVGAWLVTRFANGRHAFEHSKDIVRFWALAGMLSTTVSATLGVTSLCLTHVADWSIFGPVWLTWWLGDAVGSFVVASLIILWWPHQSWGYAQARSWEAALALFLLSIGGVVVFGGWFPYPYVCLPLVLWVAFRLGPRETASAIFIVSAIAIWNTVRGSGPFVAETTNASLLLVQTFVGIGAVTTMAVAAVVSERKSAVQGLRSAHDQLELRVKQRTEALSYAIDALRTEISERTRAENRFRQLLESAPDAMIIVDDAGEVLLVNSRTEEIFGYHRNDIIGRHVEVLVPDHLRAMHEGNRAAYTSTPEARPMGLGIDLHGLRKDGSEFPIEIALSPIDTEEGKVICAAVRDITEQRRLEEEIAESSRRRAEDLRDFAVSVQEAQEEERRRLARELHDDLGQRLSGIKLTLQALESEFPKGNRRESKRLKRVMHEFDTMIADVRRWSYDLRPAALDDFGLVAALHTLCSEFEKLHDIETEFESEDSVRSFHEAGVDIALYRIAQEALTNTAKHAGASRVLVRLFGENGSIVLTVEDNGCGFNPDVRRKLAPRGMGLLSMRERSELLGGSFKVESNRLRGTKVRARLPLAQQRANEPNQNTNSG